DHAPAPSPVPTSDHAPAPAPVPTPGRSPAPIPGPIPGPTPVPTSGPIPAPAEGSTPQDSPGRALGGARSPLRRWEVWRVALAGALLTVPQFAVLSFTAIFLHDVKGGGAALAGVTVMIAQLGGGAARIWTGRRTDRRGNRRTYLRGIGVLAGLAMVAAAALTDAPTPITVTALAFGGLLANSWHGIAYTEIAALAGPNRAGTALGLIGTTVFAVGFLTPLLIPVVLDHATWTAVWALAGAASLLAVPLAPAGRVRAR
ncbi:MFS transporter, partial [Nonomuraea antimicrobica]|uniref:MFS transporter n=1 Tax=Nonomuraea antimicrobica TaxID=561173 RepID=UPI0031EEA98D